MYLNANLTRYTLNHRPQTNVECERFWLTLNDDLINGTHFESLEHFKQGLLYYMIYYNQLRPHPSAARDDATKESLTLRQTQLYRPYSVRQNRQRVRGGCSRREFLGSQECAGRGD